MKKFRILLLFLSLFLLVGCNETLEEKEEEFDNSYEDTINNTGDYDIGESFDFMDFASPFKKTIFSERFSSFLFLLYNLLISCNIS